MFNSRLQMQEKAKTIFSFLIWLISFHKVACRLILLYLSPSNHCKIALESTHNNGEAATDYCVHRLHGCEHRRRHVDPAEDKLSKVKGKIPIIIWPVE